MINTSETENFQSFYLKFSTPDFTLSVCRSLINIHINESIYQPYLCYKSNTGNHCAEYFINMQLVVRREKD